MNDIYSIYYKYTVQFTISNGASIASVPVRIVWPERKREVTVLARDDAESVVYCW